MEKITQTVTFNETSTEAFATIKTVTEYHDASEYGRTDIVNIPREMAMKIAARCNVVRAKESDVDFAAFLNTSLRELGLHAEVDHEVS